ncbi:MAG: large repetitive protein [Solirubrobacteraceae bacterium]|nr:large repetitive protein [Solirubrobacteraceae bacterium]
MAGAVLALGLGADGAAAAFVDPPPMPTLLTMFPDRDFVSIEGLQGNTGYTIRVIRNGVTIGSAHGSSAADGILEVNHPGGICWEGTTPNILARDQVVATRDGDPLTDGDAGTLVELSGTQAQEAGSQVIVHGTGHNGPGGTLDLGSIEQRIVNPDLLALGLKRDLRAIPGGVFPDGALTADPVDPVLNPDGDHWTATYDGLDADQRAAAVAGQTRVLGWEQTNAAGDRLGISIYEVGEVGGPGFGGCPAGSNYAVTGSDRPAVTKAMKDAASSLTLSGVSQGASAVDVALSDGSTEIIEPASVPQPATGAQTWSVTFSAAQLASLKDGTLTASGSYTVTDPSDPTKTTKISGVSKTIAKDTVAPGDPGATPAPGTYRTSQTIALTGADSAAQIRYTVDGSDPTAASAIASGQLQVTSSMTFRAIAIDPVGNTSAISALTYVIDTPVQGTGGTGGPGPGAPTGTSAAGTPAAGAPAAPAAEPAAATPAAAAAVAASAAQPALALKQLGMAPRVKQRRAQKLGIRLVMRLSEGTEVVRIRIYRRTASGLKLVSDGYRAPSSTAGLYRVTQSHLGLRRQLRRGSYEVQVTPGYSRSEPGRTSRVRFGVV